MINASSSRELSNILLKDLKLIYDYPLTENKFKFLYFSDVHFSSIPPAGRFDNYPMTIIKKVEWLMNHAKTSGCQFAVCGGDFNTSVARDSNREEHKTLLSNIIKSYNIPIFLNPGNHDTLTTYATLFEAPLCWFINDGSLIPFVSLTVGVNFQIIAIPYGSQNPEVFSDAHETCNGVIQKLLNENYHDKMIFFVIHQLVDSYYYSKYGVDWNILKQFKPKAVFVGHEHAYRGTYDKHELTYIQPGAVSRYHNSVDEHKRIPNIAEITVDVSTKTYNVNYIQIPIEEPAHVFYLTQKDVKNDIDSFRESITELSNVLFSTDGEFDREKDGVRLRELIQVHAKDDVYKYLDTKLSAHGY